MANLLLNSLVPTAAPRLPTSPNPPDAVYLDQLNNILRLYFNQIDGLLGSLVSGQGGRFLNIPYGAFSSYTAQSMSAANTATLVTMTNTDFTNGVSLSASKMIVANDGIYNMQFSVQMQNLQNAPQDAFIWLRQNGVDIIGSTGVVGFEARKSPSDPAHDIKGWNYFLSMKAGDYIEIYWSATDVLVTLPTFVASVLPTKPSTASVVATMTFVSALPT